MFLLCLRAIPRDRLLSALLYAVPRKRWPAALGAKEVLQVLFILLWSHLVIVGMEPRFSRLKTCVRSTRVRHRC